MNKNVKNKEGDRIIELMEQEEQAVESETSAFYPDGIIANFTPSSEKQPLAPLLAYAKQPSAPQSPTQEQLFDTCLQIRENVQQGKPGNVEVQFNKGRQISDKQLFPLGNTAVKITLIGANDPHYLFIKADDTLNAHVFLGGNNAPGILAIEGEHGDEYFLQITEIASRNLYPLKTQGIEIRFSQNHPQIFQKKA